MDGPSVGLRILYACFGYSSVPWTMGRWRRALFWDVLLLLGIASMLWIGPWAPLLIVLAQIIDAALVKPLRPVADINYVIISVVALVLGLASTFIFRSSVIEAFKIPAGSMIPTIEVGDHIFVNKLAYGLRVPFSHTELISWGQPKRGDVIVFIYPKDRRYDYIKRVVAVGGDTIQIKDNVITLNGKTITRHELPGSVSYDDYDEDGRRWSQGTGTRVEEELGGAKYTTILDARGLARDFPEVGGPFTVPADSVFVLGDNRNNSNDSRFWGTVPLANVKGRAASVWWSGGPAGPRWGRIGHWVQ